MTHVTTVTTPATRRDELSEQEDTVKRLYIDLTEDQVRELQPIENALKQHRGAATIGQVMFYEGRTVLIVGLLRANLVNEIEKITMSVTEDQRLHDLALDATPER